MKKSIYALFTLLLLCCQATTQAQNLSQSNMTAGLKSVLDQAAQIAITQLGKQGGFSNDANLRIKLPGKLEQASRLLKNLGLGEQVTQLENSMNRAAETAIPEAKQMLLNSIKQMTFTDAKNILTGGDRAATNYLEKTNRTELFNKFLPKVKSITDKIELSTQYNALVGKVAAFGLADKNLTIENYVANKTLDGLFSVISDQESYLRNNPKQAATSVAKRLFEMLKNQN